MGLSLCRVSQAPVTRRVSGLLGSLCVGYTPGISAHPQEGGPEGLCAPCDLSVAWQLYPQSPLRASLPLAHCPRHFSSSS